MSGGKFNPWYVDVEHPTRRLSLIQVSLTSSSKAQGSWMDEHCVPWLRALLHRSEAAGFHTFGGSLLWSLHYLIPAVLRRHETPDDRPESRQSLPKRISWIILNLGKISK